MPPATQTHVILYGMVWHMGCHWSSRSLISVIGIISINVSKHCVCDCGLIHWWIMIRICSMILRHSADCRRTWRALTEENSYMQFLHFFVNQMLYLQGRCYRGGHGAQFPNVGQFSHQMLCPPPRQARLAAVRSSVTKLVNMIFWKKRMDQFWCQLAQVIRPRARTWNEV